MKTEEPKLVDSDNVMGDNYTHPAFGLISASRIQSNGTTLFDSNLKHNHYIEIEISGAILHRQKGYRYIHDKEKFIRVALSEAQWAAFVSSLNVGAGTPVTLRRVMGIERAELKPQPSREKFQAEFDEIQKEATGQLKNIIKNIKEFITNKKIPKKVGEELLYNLGIASGRAEDNAKFMSDCFTEDMEKTVNAGKAEIEAHALLMMGKLGVVSKEHKELPEGTKPIKMLEE